MRREDFIARAILRGLGWSERNLPLLCVRLSLDKEAAKTDKLVFTATSILDAVSGGLFGPLSPSRKYLLDFRSLRTTEAFWTEEDGEADELCELASALPGGAIVFSERSQDKNARRCVATVFLHDGDIPEWILQPTSVLRAKKRGMWVWIRDGEALVRDMAQTMNWDVPTPPA